MNAGPLVAGLGLSEPACGLGRIGGVWLGKVRRGLSWARERVEIRVRQADSLAARLILPARLVAAFVIGYAAHLLVAVAGVRGW